MENKHILLVGDDETGEWSMAVNTADEKVAQSEYESLKKDGTPSILIYTGDFVTC